MIRFLIDTTVSKRDVNGNCYNHSTITSTKTGMHLHVVSGYGSDGGNVKSLLRKSGLEWEELHYSERVVPIREFNQLEKMMMKAKHFFEHSVNKNDFLSLEA